jgi:hypothetical protein
LQDEAARDFTFSVRELGGNGAGSDVDLFAEHRHGPLSEPGFPLQQQWHGPVPQQQHLCWLEVAAVPQQECLDCIRVAQWGHFTATADFDGLFWQSQASKGKASTGTNMAASQTRTFAKMLSENRITQAACLPGEGSPPGFQTVTAHAIDSATNWTLSFPTVGVKNETSGRDSRIKRGGKLFSQSFVFQ